MNPARTLLPLAVALASAGGAMAAARAQGEVSVAPLCSVFVQRNQPDGIIDITRQVLPDGGCNCVLHTGGTGQGGAAEQRVAQVVGARACPDAHLMEVPPPGEAMTLQAGGLVSLDSVLPEAEPTQAAGSGVIRIKEDIAAGP